MIEHAHLIGLAPPHLINHAHQIAEEGVAINAASNESLEGEDEVKGDGKKDKQKRTSVTGEPRIQYVVCLKVTR